MPNHWESSARPLFVKTVFVNGSRHAILFEKDPLLHGVNFPLKKTSRPNSSLSFASGISISSSEESQSTNSERKISKFKNIDQSKEKNLSSELQNCLIKFKLASDGSKNKNKVVKEKCICNCTIEHKRGGNSKQKKPKENRNKSGKRCEHFHEEQNENKLTERKISREKSCYIYNLENYKGRKNYCFVKITSQPPQFILNCSCESDWSEIQNNCNPQNKNNLVISASIQNLIMTPNENENLLEKTLDYVLPFENPTLHWNNCLTKSFYNSLAERVFQWLDMARKRKKPAERLNLREANDCGTSVERIYSGKKFAQEAKKNENSLKSNNKVSSNRKNKKLLQNDTSEEEIEEELMREQNVETLLSMEKTKNNLSKKPKSQEKVLGEIAGDKAQLPYSSSPDFNLSTNSIPFHSSKESNLAILNMIKTPIKIQDLFLNSSSNESNLVKNRNVKKTKEPRKAAGRQNKLKEIAQRGAERDFIVNEEGDKTDVFKEKCDNHYSHSQCSWNRNLDKYTYSVNSQILTEEFAERNQQSINNPNITRTRPDILRQNMSPQHDKISSLEEEKTLWASEKNTQRPQLHIFMPSVLLKDQSDDSMSECETFLNS